MRSRAAGAGAAAPLPRAGVAHDDRGGHGRGGDRGRGGLRLLRVPGEHRARPSRADGALHVAAAPEPAASPRAQIGLGVFWIALFAPVAGFVLNFAAGDEDDGPK